MKIIDWIKKLFTTESIPCSPLTIPLIGACTAVSHWKNYVDQSATRENFVKAFVIPRADILAMADIMRSRSGQHIEGYRAYLGADYTAGRKDPYNPSVDEPYHNPRLLMVAVTEGMPPTKSSEEKKVYNDVINTDPVDGHQTATVYDFTKPCPDSCDQLQSPLLLPR